MRVAISARGTGLGCQFEPRFERAEQFLLVDMDSGAWQVLDVRASRRPAGDASVQVSRRMVEQGVKVVIVEQVSSTAREALCAAGVQLFSTQAVTVQDALRAYGAARLSVA
jgi:predicted Fe-Mo cluster-binding NifX family protein